MSTPKPAANRTSAQSASIGKVPVPAIQQERILQHAWHLKKNDYRESTITSRVKLLRSLARRVDLFDPEAVKGIIALLNVTESRKEMLSCGYLTFCRQFNLPYAPPPCCNNRDRKQVTVICRLVCPSVGAVSP
jgi:hypothetical protein